MREALENPSITDDLRCTARRRDPLARARAEGVGADGERVGERTLAEALDRAAPARKAARPELVGTDRAARREGPQLREIDDDVRHPRHGLEAALRQATLERHLTALVPRRAV